MQEDNELVTNALHCGIVNQLVHKINIQNLQEDVLWHLFNARRESGRQETCYNSILTKHLCIGGTGLY